MLNAGWNAHTLNAPGKFLVSAPEHTTPRRARAYLVTDDGVARTVARYAGTRSRLDDVSRRAILPGTAADLVAWDDPGGARGDSGQPGPVPWYFTNPHGNSGDAQGDPDEPAAGPDEYDTTRPEDALWLALCSAPDEGADIAELMRLSGMTRPTLYRHLAQLARAGRAIQVSRGRWRAAANEDPR
jgi:S-DNA-T family DNA segregation ATPase FtsK/SpoIIIE